MRLRFAHEKQLFEGAADIFRKHRKQQADNTEEDCDKLYVQVGWLKVEVDWIKKSPDIWVEQPGKNSRDRASDNFGAEKDVA